MAEPRYGVRVFPYNLAYGKITWYATPEAQEKAYIKAKKSVPKKYRYVKKVNR